MGLWLSVELTGKLALLLFSPSGAEFAGVRNRSQRITQGVFIYDNTVLLFDKSIFNCGEGIEVMFRHTA
ncbi:uncharacterized protein N7446_011991 [Penicillium canescens]|uniref:uncharacterized protein n=1 Tax=Penicillium canescens TaxID=5083 RepID=UPI0026DF4B0A|nr:uncharacterized protein N7446_011991 [Penicillium canescens]KAJ6047157.1 hypothetical protein N7446_011991 [Penicillium canescens]KAJ6174418.1 hypothetical protein N7485_005484 [Penicillium canescens]